MHPPFFVVDHRIDHDVLPVEERKVIRRSQPARLRFDLPAPGTPVVVVGPVGPPPPLQPSLWARLRAMIARRRLRRGVVAEP